MAQYDNRHVRIEKAPGQKNTVSDLSESLTDKLGWFNCMGKGPLLGRWTHLNPC